MYKLFYLNGIKHSYTNLALAMQKAFDTENPNAKIVGESIPEGYRPIKSFNKPVNDIGDKLGNFYKILHDRFSDIQDPFTNAFLDLGLSDSKKTLQRYAYEYITDAKKKDSKITFTTTKKTVEISLQTHFPEDILTIDWGDNTQLQSIVEANDCCKSCDHIYLDNLSSHTITIIGRIKSLDIHDMKVDSLNISQCTGLRHLYCSHNNLKELDLSNSRHLAVLRAVSNNFSEEQKENILSHVPLGIGNAKKFIRQITEDEIISVNNDDFYKAMYSSIRSKLFPDEQ